MGVWYLAAFFTHAHRHYNISKSGTSRLLANRHPPQRGDASCVQRTLRNGILRTSSTGATFVRVRDCLPRRTEGSTDCPRRFQRMDARCSHTYAKARPETRRHSSQLQFQLETDLRFWNADRGADHTCATSSVKQRQWVHRGGPEPIGAEPSCAFDRMLSKRHS